MATATIVVRRALGSSRDVRLAGDALRAAGMAPGPALAAALASDAWGVVLVALRGEHPCGVLVLRFLRAPGDAHDGPVSLALVDVLDGDPDTREVLLAAARAEAEGRDAARFVVDAPPLRRAAPVGDRVVLTLAPGVTATVDPSVQAPETSTLWSGAMAFRTRWRNDRVAPGWSVEGCLGTPDDNGDALRFDASTRMLREVYLARPTRLRIDEAVLARAMAAPSLVGVLRLDEATPFVLPPMDDALFDVSLDGFVALRDGLDAHGLVAVAASPHLHLLFAEGTYAGWRVCDPVAHARPMGWPEARDAEPPSPARVEALRALLYDWMVIDASARVDPTTSESPEDVVHMVALRDRALALAAGDDVVAAVARDVASHTHWSWGFYRLGP